MLNVLSQTSSMFQNFGLQIGPQYDPLFYDVMIYIFGTMLFGVFLLSVISFWLGEGRALGGASAKEKWTPRIREIL
ncbi:MAG: hypothetical protein P0116_02200 [Candidatus Nitrosocosmicus sp.]|nr:hypothetical protein [Candidatus Nitrosocosmicus sp.]